jgi:hypothetical protein
VAAPMDCPEGRIFRPRGMAISAPALLLARLPPEQRHALRSNPCVEDRAGFQPCRAYAPATAHLAHSPACENLHRFETPRRVAFLAYARSLGTRVCGQRPCGAVGLGALRIVRAVAISVRSVTGSAEACHGRIMPYHRLKIGQTVVPLTPSLPTGRYTIIELLPLAHDELHYRVRSEDEHERVVLEEAIRLPATAARARSRLPSANCAGRISLTSAQLAALLDECEWLSPVARQRPELVG